jgi:hypothetical protein
LPQRAQSEHEGSDAGRGRDRPVVPKQLKRPYCGWA